jgi:hypothetical protein
MTASALGAIANREENAIPDNKDRIFVFIRVKLRQNFACMSRLIALREFTSL